MEVYLCGVEGGASSSEAVILSSHGKELSKVVGPPVNQWIIGISHAVSLTVSLIRRAMHEANIQEDTRLDVVGLALSGIDAEAIARSFEAEFSGQYPQLANHVFVCNDTIGAIFSATDKGGIILIAGTGSNCKLVNEDLSSFGVGGHGYMLGDEGSAFWITHRVIKTCVDNDEGLVICPHDTRLSKKAIYEHFSIKSNAEILTPLYNFKKDVFSSLCKKLAKLARDNDELTRSVFRDAGYFLAAHVMAVLQKAEPTWRCNSEGVDIICRGKVFNSWDLLEDGFRERITPDLQSGELARCLRLIKLESSAAFGVAILAARLKIGLSVPRHHTEKVLAEFR